MIIPNDPDMQCDFSQPITWIQEEEETSSVCPKCSGTGDDFRCTLCHGKGEVELDKDGNKIPDDE